MSIPNATCERIKLLFSFSPITQKPVYRSERFFLYRQNSEELAGQSSFKYIDNYDQSRLPFKFLFPEAIPSLLLPLHADHSINLETINNFPIAAQNVTEVTDTSKSEIFKLPPEIPDARYIGDLKPDHFNTPLRAKRHIDMIQKYVKGQRLTIKKLKRENPQTLVKVKNVEDLLRELSELNLLSENRHDVILDSLSDSMKGLLKRQLVTKNVAYTPQLRTFALTLHFYSPKAYSYVRSAFDKLLPHPATITKWYSVVDGHPGFTKEVVEAIKLRVAYAKRNKKSIIVNLVLDHDRLVLYGLPKRNIP